MPKPNILMIVTDQEAYYRHGWDGGLGPARPHLDRFGSEGIRFERAYTACPLCTPARRTMLTGLFPHTHGFLTLDEKENSAEKDRGMLYDLLAEQGYRLYGYGKWHAGPGTARDFGVEGFSPPGYGNPYITPEYEVYCRERGLEPASFEVDHIFMEAVSPDEPAAGPGYRCTAPGFHPHVTGVLETPTDTHDAQFVANLACDKLRRLAAENGGQPFFMRVDMWGPHAPYLPSPEFLELYPPEKIAEYGNFRDDLSTKPPVYLKEWNRPFGCNNRLQTPNVLPWREWQRIMSYVYGQVTQVDAACGQVVDTLDELGLAEDTLVIWTADHGDAVVSFGGHFGKEACLTEEVLRIPMAMRWTGRIEPGQTSQQLVSNMDCPATILEAAGGTFKGPVDGVSLFNLLEEGKLQAGAGRSDLMCETHGHHWEPVKGRAIVTERYRYAVYQYHGQPDYLAEVVDTATPIEELYDLQADPFQLNNLASQPEYQPVMEDHRQRLLCWQQQTGDPVRFSW